MQLTCGLLFLSVSMEIMSAGADGAIVFAPVPKNVSTSDAVVANLLDDPMGYISAFGWYMFCNPNCAMFTPNPACTQQFRFSGGQFHAHDLSGKDLGMCLNAGCNGCAVSLGACNVPNSQNWQTSNYISQFANGGWWGMQYTKLPATWLRTAACVPGVSCLATSFPLAVPCKLLSQTVTDLKCKNPISAGTCSASFKPGSTQGAHSEQSCDACKAPKGETQDCAFKFSLQTQNQISSTIIASTQTEKDLTIEVGLDFIVDDKTTFEYKVQRSLTVGQTITETKTYNIEQGCTTHIKAGTAADAIANVLTGTLIGDYTATLTSKYECKEVPETVSGQITITNVPSLAITGSCKVTAIPCNSTLISNLVV